MSFELIYFIRNYFQFLHGLCCARNNVTSKVAASQPLATTKQAGNVAWRESIHWCNGNC